MRFQMKRILLCGCVALTLFSCCPARVLASQQRAVVILDAGHGGEDGGAVAADGTAESGINLQITRQVAQVLIFMGFDVISSIS